MMKKRENNETMPPIPEDIFRRRPYHARVERRLRCLSAGSLLLAIGAMVAHYVVPQAGWSFSVCGTLWLLLAAWQYRAAGQARWAAPTLPVPHYRYAHARLRLGSRLRVLLFLLTPCLWWAAGGAALLAAGWPAGVLAMMGLLWLVAGVLPAVVEWRSCRRSAADAERPAVAIPQWQPAMGMLLLCLGWLPTSLTAPVAELTAPVAELTAPRADKPRRARTHTPRPTTEEIAEVLSTQAEPTIAELFNEFIASLDLSHTTIICNHDNDCDVQRVVASVYQGLFNIDDNQMA